MTEPWMIISLAPPPVLTVQIHFNDGKGLSHACENITRVLAKQSPLHKESALLSRFLYKYDKKFRNDLGYRNIRKINTSLKKYLQLNLYKDIENFIAMLPNDEDDYYPTRQMLEYVLVRIITFSKIMLRVCILSKKGAVFYFDRVKRGESHWMSLVPYALLSRVYSLCTVLLHHSTSWYASLHNYLEHLQPKGLNFLPGDYKLPNDLKIWLDLKDMENFGRFNWSQKKIINIDMSDLDNEEFSTFENILGFINNINAEDDDEGDMESKPDELVKTVSEDKSGINDKQDFSKPVVIKYDHGVAISRESYLSTTHTKIDMSEKVSKESISILNMFQKKITSENTSHYFGKVTNLKTLNVFIDKEQTFRNEEDKKSLTSHLSFMQWETLKSSLIKVCDDLSKSRKVVKKLQKVWKEKCLDYIHEK